MAIAQMPQTKRSHQNRQRQSSALHVLHLSQARLQAFMLCSTSDGTNLRQAWFRFGIFSLLKATHGHGEGRIA
jgi:hypothetical protein